MAFPTVICHGDMLRPFLSGAVQCQEYESAPPMQPVAVGVYPGGGSQQPPSNMAIFPIRSPHAMDNLPCPPWQDHPHQHSNAHPYPPHYTTELPQCSIGVLQHPVEGHYLPVSPPIESLPASTASHVAEVNTLCNLPRLPVTGTHSQSELILHPVHSGGPQCAVLEPVFIDSSCPVGDTGSLSSPVALQHYLPANIEKELLALNTTIQDTFQASDNGMPPDGKWEEMIGRHFVAQASLILEANLSGSAQKFELQRSSIPSFFVNLQEEGVCDMYFSYQGCQIDINSPISSVDCPKATLVISYTKPVAFKVFAHGVLSLKYYENAMECQESGLGQHRLQLLSFTIEDHEEFVKRSVLTQSLEVERGRAESSGGSPKATFLSGELTHSGLTERMWQFLQLHCCAVRSDVTPDGPQSVSTPMEPQTHSPFDLPCSEAENACRTPTLGGGGDNDTVFSNSPTVDENGSSNGKQSLASHRKRPRSHSAVGEGGTRSRRHNRRPSSSSQRKPSYTMLVVEEPVKLSECDVQVDAREILKIERYSHSSLSNPTAAESANFADQLEVPLTGPDWSGGEPLQDDVSNRTSGSV